MKTTLFILCGIPASGKSTWALDYYNNLCGSEAVYFSRDAIRQTMVEEDEELFSHELCVFKEFCDKIAEWLEFHNVIADASHIDYASRAELVEELAKRGLTKDDYDIIFVVFHITYKRAVERDLKRIGRARVGEEAIFQYHSHFFPPHKTDFSNVKGIWHIYDEEPV